MWIDRYSDFVEAFLRSNEVLAPLLLLILEEAGLPLLVPGDAILAYVGAAVKHSNYPVSLITATIVAALAVLIGSSILYFISKRWGTILVRKLGKFLFIKESHIEHAEKLFAKYGVLTIIFGRHIPGMRAPITIFAAISGVKYPTFIISTFISAILWIYFWLNVGHRYGQDIQNIIHRHTWPSIIVILLIIAAIIFAHFYGEYRSKRKHKSK